jgi:FMN-dependent NADH-azoreductase
MKKILHIDSSINGERSFSRKLSAEIVKHLKNKDSNSVVTYLDLCKNAPSHFSASDYSTLAENSYLKQVFEHDIIIIGAPMYNFSISSQLKAWIDRLAVKGITFKYTESGVLGLINNKKIIIASTQGGIYTTEVMKSFEHQESYLKAFFNFVGITDISIIRVEGINMGEKQIEISLSNAQEEIKKI